MNKMDRFDSLALVLLLTCQGLMAGEIVKKCKILENCVALSPVAELKNHVPVTEDELKFMCPQTLQYAHCLLDEIGNCTGQDIFERTPSENNTIDDTSALVEDLKEVIADTCDENSTLYRGYLSHVECFSSFVNRSDLQQYRYDGLVIYDAYRQSRELRGERRDPDERQCMSSAYAFGAFSAGLRKNCGSEANATFLEIFRRLKKLFRNFNKCSNAKVNILRTRFMAYLDSLGTDERHLRMFSAVFRVMR